MAPLIFVLALAGGAGAFGFAALAGHVTDGWAREDKWVYSKPSAAERKIYDAFAQRFIRAVRRWDVTALRTMLQPDNFNLDGTLYEYSGAVFFGADGRRSGPGSLRFLFGQGKVLTFFSKITIPGDPPSAKTMQATFVPKRYLSEYRAAFKAREGSEERLAFFRRGGACKFEVCIFRGTGNGFRDFGPPCRFAETNYGPYLGCERAVPPPANLPKIVRSKSAEALAIAFPAMLLADDRRSFAALNDPRGRSPELSQEAWDAAFRVGLQPSMLARIEGKPPAAARSVREFFLWSGPVAAIIHEWNPDWNERYCEGDGYCGDDNYISYDRVIGVLYVTESALEAMKTTRLRTLRSMRAIEAAALYGEGEAWKKRFTAGRDYVFQAFEQADGVWRMSARVKLEPEMMTLTQSFIDPKAPRNSFASGAPVLHFEPRTGAQMSPY